MAKQVSKIIDKFVADIADIVLTPEDKEKLQKVIKERSLARASHAISFSIYHPGTKETLEVGTKEKPISITEARKLIDEKLGSQDPVFKIPEKPRYPIADLAKKLTIMEDIGMQVKDLVYDGKEYTADTLHEETLAYQREKRAKLQTERNLKLALKERMDDCVKKGGKWNAETNICEMPTQPPAGPKGSKKLIKKKP